MVRCGSRSLPLLSRFLQSPDQDLHYEAFEIARRIGPEVIPLLSDLLGNGDVSVRRRAADTLIDFAPDTDFIQPALRAALRDEDVQVARDAARALGAPRNVGDRPVDPNRGGIMWPEHVIPSEFARVAAQR